MAQTTTQAPPAVGSFCWFELNTRAVDDVKKFYGELFGWKTTPSQMGFYHHWHDRDGVMFGGIMDASSPEWEGVPSHWMSYIQVEDVDAKAKNVTELGGNVCVPPTDIPTVGRFCVINDPTGPTLSLIQLEDPKAIAPVIVWNECMTRDAASAKKFYTQLLGWTTENMPMGGETDYILCKNGEDMLGGIFQMTGPKFEHVPPHWLNYIGTKQVDADAAKVEKLGGKVIVPPTDIPNIGRFCVITDPGGGHIAFYQSASQQ
jgi:predicted enzyme related to lactoylglutathione lyase